MRHDEIWDASKGEKIGVLMMWRRTERMSQQLFDNMNDATRSYDEIDHEARESLERKSCDERDEIRLFEELTYAIANGTCVCRRMEWTNNAKQPDRAHVTL